MQPEKPLLGKGDKGGCDSPAVSAAQPIPSGEGTEGCVSPTDVPTHGRTDAPSSSAPSASATNAQTYKRTNAQEESASADPADFSATLGLARLSRNEGIRSATDLIVHKDYSQAIAVLDAVEKGDYSWRIELTNSYQNGFVLCALKGYCLEQVPDPPKAYRQYQNSRFYVDEDTVQSIMNEPRIEVMRCPF